MSIQKVKGRTYVETEYMGANASCVNIEQGLVLVDTPHLPIEIFQWQETLIKLNNNGIAYVINTHHHFDHCLGNAFYSSNIIAHQSCYEEMAKPDGTMRNYFVSTNEELPDEVKKQLYEIPIALPRFTFNERMWLHFDDANFELIHVGGHSESSIIVLAVEDKILFTGDNLVTNTHPYKGQADFRQWIKALEMIKDMDIDVIIPGHGEICDKAEVGRMLEYFRLMRDRVMRLREEGCSKELVIQQTHELIDYYPIEPGEEALQNTWFDEGVARLYDQIEAAS